MKVETFFYKEGKGWSVDKFPELDSDKTLVMVFAAPEFLGHDEKVKELLNHYPKSNVVGCSSAGEVFQETVQDHSLSVSIIQFKDTETKVVAEPIKSADQSNSVGKKIAEGLKREDLSGVMVFSDGLRVNGTTLLSGINASLPGVVVTGGLAGDGEAFKETWVIQNRAPTTGYVVAVGFYGKNFRMGHGSQGGWDIFGPERKVTKSKENVLYELDGQPALALYKEYLGDKSKDLPASGLLFPLQIRDDSSATKRLVRTILAVNEEDQSMVFAGDIKEGSLAQLMRANFDRLIDGAATAATTTAKTEPHGPTLVVAISCVGRRLVLGERTDEEVEATLDKLPSGTKQVGFYSYGEISPHVKDGPCELHNQTMTLTTIWEEAA